MTGAAVMILGPSVLHIIGNHNNTGICMLWEGHILKKYWKVVGTAYFNCVMSEKECMHVCESLSVCTYSKNDGYLP